MREIIHLLVAWAGFLILIARSTLLLLKMWRLFYRLVWIHWKC
jgi:hypothetical protein